MQVRVLPPQPTFEKGPRDPRGLSCSRPAYMNLPRRSVGLRLFQENSQDLHLHAIMSGRAFFLGVCIPTMLRERTMPAILLAASSSPKEIRRGEHAPSVLHVVVVVVVGVHEVCTVQSSETIPGFGSSM